MKIIDGVEEIKKPMKKWQVYLKGIREFILKKAEEKFNGDSSDNEHGFQFTLDLSEESRDDRYDIRSRMSELQYYRETPYSLPNPLYVRTKTLDLSNEICTFVISVFWDVDGEAKNKYLEHKKKIKYLREKRNGPTV